jgi:hypothetical protein
MRCAGTYRSGTFLHREVAAVRTGGRVGRGGLLLVGAILAVFPLVRVGPVAGQATLTQQLPFTVWGSGEPVGLEALGSWLFAGQYPAGSPYVYAHTFSLLGRAPAGVVALADGPGGKLAGFTVFDSEGSVNAAAVPYDWQPGRHYLPLVYKATQTVVASAVYDNVGATWTHIGAFQVPAEWGLLSSVSVTWAGWYGAPVAACEGYPVATVNRDAPIGAIDDIVLHGIPVFLDAELEGDCSADAIVTVTQPQIVQYILGGEVQETS